MPKVIILFKKNDATIIANHRPLSLYLSVIFRIFESAIFNQTNDYFTMNNLFYDKQYGFLKNHSTELAALNVVDNIITNMENGNALFSVYLALPKEFNTLNHSILFDKLKFYRIRGTSLDLVKHYFSNWKQWWILTLSDHDSNRILKLQMKAILIID